MKANHWLIPIGIAGVVVTIWAALRKSGSNPAVIVQASPSLNNGLSNPGYTPFGAPEINTSVSPSGAPDVITQAPSASSSGVPNYVTPDVSGGSLQLAPKPAQSVPSFYGPIQDFIRSFVPVADINAITPPKKESSCGCGGGGGCNSQCASPCSTSNSRFPDGRGGCLAATRAGQIKSMMKMGPTHFFAASENLASADVDLFKVYQQTVFDQEQMRGGTPASPFSSPV